MAMGGGGLGAGAQDRPGLENKVMLSAQQSGCLIIPGSGGRCGGRCGGSQPSSGTYSDHIVPEHSQEGPRPFSLYFEPWFM